VTQVSLPPAASFPASAQNPGGPGIAVSNPTGNPVIVARSWWSTLAEIENSKSLWQPSSRDR